MSMNLYTALVGILLGAITCLAADVDGRWTGTMTTRNGAVMVIYVLKADGDKLTGTTSGRNGDVPIADGKVDGNNISFTVSIDVNGKSYPMSYKGVVTKDEIKFTTEIGGRSSDLVVKRVR
jgi:hypothetical protein